MAKTKEIASPSDFNEQLLTELRELNETLRSFLNVFLSLPEMLIAGGLVSYQGTNRVPETVAKNARDYAEALLNGMLNAAHQAEGHQEG